MPSHTARCRRSHRHASAAASLASSIACAILATAASNAEAQVCPAGETCFYVPPAMVGPATPPDVVSSELWLSVPSGMATGTYRVDDGTDVPFTVTSTGALQVPLLLTAMSSAVNVPETRGVFITSSREDLLVEHKQALFMSGSYTEGYSETVPRHTVALGRRFRLGGFRMTTPSPLAPPRAATSQYAMIVAPTGATVTLSAPPGASLPYWTGEATETHTVTLAAGESASVGANASLNGALVVATTPISIASGGRGWLSPCGDDGSDVLVPTSQLGTEFAVRLPSGSATGSDVAVIADTDGTEVRVDGALVATLDAGESHSFVPTTPTHVETSLPALVWMNGSYFSCELDTALIPPLELAALALSITFNASFSGEVAVVIPTTEAGAVTLDGAALTPSSTTALTGRADISTLVFTVGAGLHTVSAASGFQLLATATGAGAGILAYFGPFVSCTTDVACEDDNPCTNSACVLNACVATPVEGGMTGACEDGLVCSGDAHALPNTCVACVSDDACDGATPVCDAATGTCTACTSDFGGTAPACPADRPMCVLAGAMAGSCVDDGMPDAGMSDAGMPDAGVRDGGRADGGGGARDGGGPDAGSVLTTDGGCCAVYGRRSERGALPLAGLCALCLAVHQRHRRRRARGARRARD